MVEMRRGYVAATGRKLVGRGFRCPGWRGQLLIFPLLIYLRNWGIRLTQVTPTCSMRVRGGLSARSGGVRGVVRDRGSLPGLPVSTALAGAAFGVRVASMRALGPCGNSGAAVCQLRAASNRPRAHWCFDKPPSSSVVPGPVSKSLMTASFRLR